MKKGEHITEETRMKMKLAHQGHTVSDETKQKISESNKEKNKKWDNPKDYWQQECLYNGWYCTLRQLSRYFRERGVEKYTTEAKKYLTGEMVQTPIRPYTKRSEKWG